MDGTGGAHPRGVRRGAVLKITDGKLADDLFPFLETAMLAGTLDCLNEYRLDARLTGKSMLFQDFDTLFTGWLDPRPSGDHGRFLATDAGRRALELFVRGERGPMTAGRFAARSPLAPGARDLLRARVPEQPAPTQSNGDAGAGSRAHGGAGAGSAGEAGGAGAAGSATEAGRSGGGGQGGTATVPVAAVRAACRNRTSMRSSSEAAPRPTSSPSCVPSNMLFVIDRSGTMACNPPPITGSARSRARAGARPAG